MKIIFLDIDGVLNTNRERRRRGSNSSRPFDAEAVTALNEILTKSGARIVVSSMWRYYNTPEELDEILTLEGVAPGTVIDKTPDLSSSRNPWIDVVPPRRDEIKAWLDEHPDVTGYVVIDDDGCAGPAHFLRTYDDDGLLLIHVDEALKILNTSRVQN